MIIGSKPGHQELTAELAREPLRHIVLLKHLLAYPDDLTIHRAAGPQGSAALLLLDAKAGPYDREAYPKASFVVLIASDHPALTASLLRQVPRGIGIVFKLSQEADLAPVAAQFAVERRTGILSFTAAGSFMPAPGVRLTTQPSEAAYRLFAVQGHDRAWLEPQLAAGKALACVLERDREALSACFAYENFGAVWEVGGVVTAPGHRGRGLGQQVVRTVLAELGRRALTPRYQVDEQNAPSIALARSVGLSLFLTVVHYAHRC